MLTQVPCHDYAGDSSDNGGTVSGINYPLRGEKHRCVLFQIGTWAHVLQAHVTNTAVCVATPFAVIGKVVCVQRRLFLVDSSQKLCEAPPMESTFTCVHLACPPLQHIARTAQPRQPWGTPVFCVLLSSTSDRVLLDLGWRVDC